MSDSDEEMKLQFLNACELCSLVVQCPMSCSSENRMACQFCPKLFHPNAHERHVRFCSRQFFLRQKKAAVSLQRNGAASSEQPEAAPVSESKDSAAFAEIPDDEETEVEEVHSPSSIARSLICCRICLLECLL
jgi:hypothetical protein